MRRTLFGFALAAASVCGFASTFVFGEQLTRADGVSPSVLSFLRFAFAGVVLLACEAATARGRARLAAPTRADWWRIVWLGPLGTSVMALFVFLGCARVSTANASMADALTPIMIFLVASLKTRRIRTHDLAGLLCGLLGAALVIRIVDAHGIALSAYSLGDVFILLSAATWGVYTVFGRDMIARLGATVFSAWTMLAGALAFGACLPFLDVSWPATSGAWLRVAGLAFVSTLMAFWTWNAAQKYLSMYVLGITAYFTPVVAVALGIVFLGESVTLLQWLGTVLVILSAVLI